MVPLSGDPNEPFRVLIIGDGPGVERPEANIVKARPDAELRETVEQINIIPVGPVTVGLNEAERAAGRIDYIRDNAIALVDELEAKVTRQKETIKRLEQSRSEMRTNIQSLQAKIIKLQDRLLAAEKKP